MHVLRKTAYLCSTAARSTIHWTVLVVTAGVVVETLAYKLQYTVVIQSAIGYMCCSIATRNCNHNLFELICNCNTTRNLGESPKTRVYTVMLCIWVKNQPYMQTRSAWHVVEVVRPCCVRAPDFRPGVWPACGAQGCESLRQSSGSVPVRD